MKVLIGKIGLRISFLTWVTSTACASYYAYYQNGTAFWLWLCVKVVAVMGMLQFGIGLWMAKGLDEMDEIDQKLERERIRKHNKSYYQGMRDALKMYAWWRDGEQFVGTQDDKKFVGCGTRTLQQALAEVDKLEQADKSGVSARHIS